MIERFLKWVSRIDWWVVAAVLLLVAAGAITVVDVFDGKDNALLFRNGVAWLNSAALACALFSLRGSLFDLRGEQMRRAYDPDVRRRDV